MNHTDSVDRICILGHEYAKEVVGNLPVVFRQRYGADSFMGEVADFLCEWFSPTPCLQVHTSGSTGTPKSMWVEKQRMVSSARLTVSFLGLKAGDTALLAMPLRYIAGKMVVVRAWVAGLDLWPVTPCGHPLASLAESPVFAALTPMQVYNTLQVPTEAERLRQVRQLIIGGGAIDASLADALRDFPHAVWSSYGMTETLSHIALRRLNGPDASDWYTPFAQVSLDLSAEGTLVIDAPLVSPKRLVTNDIAEFNAHGQFRIMGRRDNTINTGGVKVQIEQVEEALRPHLSFPFLISSVPDPKFGERVVMLAASAVTLFSPEIVAAFSPLPPYWCPKQLIQVAHIPLTGTGKPDRAAARRLARGLKG
ncbi:MAG: AMP-binding protein [Prevotella sp.]|nr:AMP-binding protein [Bacteroidales bacterium]